eukprot:348141_1
MKSVIRSIKNELNKYSESEQLVRTITSNNDTPPTKLMLAQLAQRLSDHNEFPPIVKMLFLRLQDYNCLFHVEKSLLCVEYLMQSGDNYKKFTRFCAKQQTTFTKLTKYRYQMDGREIGKNVRRRARRILGKLNVARGRAQSEHAIKKRNFEWETFDHIDDAKHKDPPTEQDPFYFMSDNDDFFSQDDLDVPNDSNALSFDANNNNHKDISTTQTTDTHEVFIISQLRSFGYKEVDIKHALNNVADKTDINGIIEYIDKRDVFSDLANNMHSIHDSLDDIMSCDISNEVNERFVWEHYDEDDCLWHEYGDNVSLKIETVHHSNAAVARMKIHGIECEIRLNEMPMNQYNLKTGKISPIRRMVKSGHVKREYNIRTSVDIPVMDPHAFHEKKPKYEWRYKQGFNVWKVYPNDINIQIEKAFRAEVDHFQFSINNQQYEIQFNFLRQVNLGTNDVNEIARIDHTAHAKRSQTMFSKSGPNPKMKVGHEPAKSFNPMEIEPVNRQKSGHNKRSATLDITQNKHNANVQAALGGGQDFEALVKQQQKAMKYFKVKHSKKNSSKQTESDSNEIHHEETNEYYPDEDIDRFRWMLRNDNGDWVYYPPSLSTQIEQAYQGGEDSINITKNDTVFEIRIEHKLECHFGTNKVRPIKRVNINAKYDPTYDAQYNEINFKPKPKPKPKPDLDIEFDALTNKLDDFGDAISNDESEDKENEEFSDYDEHDEDEKDYEYREAQAHRNRTKTPQRPIDMRESTSYDEQESTPAAKQEPEAGTPADSEFALKDYGNDYNEYIQKFNNLNQGYFE